MPETPPPLSSRADLPPVGDSTKKNGVVVDGDNLVAPLSLAEKLHDAAASAAASAAEAASTAASSAAGGEGGSAKGRWERETFILPLPEEEVEEEEEEEEEKEEEEEEEDKEEDEGCLAVQEKERNEQDGGGGGGRDGVGMEEGEEECVEVPDLAEPTLEAGRDTEEGSEGSRGCADDGVSLRLEVWQGRHCYGQVRIVSSPHHGHLTS